jgi:hypothetical protein
VKGFNVGFIGCCHEFAHISLKIETIDLIRMLFLVALQDELVVQLNQLHTASLLPAESEVPVLPQVHSRRYILELEYPLEGLQTLIIIFIVVFVVI